MELKSEFIHPDPKAPVVVIFGGSPHMRDGVIRIFEQWVKVTAYGTLSEEEGLQKLRELEKVDLVLIGGRYSADQRVRIKEAAKRLFPTISTTEPGVDYPYDHVLMLADIDQKLKNHF